MMSLSSLLYQFYNGNDGDGSDGSSVNNGDEYNGECLLGSNVLLFVFFSSTGSKVMGCF